MIPIPSGKMVLIAAVALIIGVQQVYIYSQGRTIKAKDEQITMLNGDLAVSKANVATLTASVERQNTAIEALKVQKAALDAKVRKQALEARRMREQSLSTEGTGADSMNDFFRRLYQ